MTIAEKRNIINTRNPINKHTRPQKNNPLHKIISYSIMLSTKQFTSYACSFTIPNRTKSTNRSPKTYAAHVERIFGSVVPLVTKRTGFTPMPKAQTISASFLSNVAVTTTTQSWIPTHTWCTPIYRIDGISIPRCRRLLVHRRTPTGYTRLSGGDTEAIANPAQHRPTVFFCARVVW